ncbi:biotin/lipoyl-containing protein [Ancylobacter dichloromethanicus]
MTDITVVGAGGEYMESVVVVAWHKKKGESVKAGELVVTVETAKAATEIEAPVSGILSDIRAQIGEEVAIGTVLGTLSEDGADTAAPAVSAAQTAPPAAPPCCGAR